MFCKHCGSEVENGAKFCGGCGAPVEIQVQEATQSNNEVNPVASPVINTPPLEQSQPVVTKKWWQKTWFAWVMLFVFPPIGIVLLWVNGIHGKIARIAISLLFGIAFIGAVSGDKDTPTTTQSSVSSSATTKAQAPKENVPREYKNALRSAEHYLKVMPMSKRGLYEQLSSKAGEKYPAAAAQYAVDHVKADWKQNALKSAEHYLKIMPMSRQGLYEQLSSSAGEKYTAEEAQYAIDHIKW